MLLLLSSAVIGAATAVPSSAFSDHVRKQAIANQRCPPIMGYETGQLPEKPELHRLNELPPADVYRAVYRTINGCMSPVIVRYGVGNRKM